MSALLDGFLPRADVSKRIELDIEATPERVWSSLVDADFGRSPIIRWLFILRGMGAGGGVPRPMDLASLERWRFAKLDERPGEHIVLGITGRFWTPKGYLQRIDREAFLAGPPAGFASAAWSFEISPGRAGGTSAATETRILAGDEKSRRSFLRYWTVIGPFSGLIRHEMLKLVRRDAERSNGTTDKETR